MILFPPCKINIGLHVLHKRNDGYHALDTLMYPVSIFDILEVVKSEEFSFTNSGIPIPGEGQMNICIKAYQLMRKLFGISPVKIHLHKQIPMGAGLGGGSSDGTYTVLAINKIFDLKLSDKRLQELAAELGSDCPFFVTSSPQVATGRGEVLSAVEFELKGMYVYLVNIGIHVSTAQAFSKVDFYTKQLKISELIKSPFMEIKDQLVNSFESSVFYKFPELNEIKNIFLENGAIYAAMSGSGSTMYGIFKDRPSIGLFSKYEVVFEEILPFS
jgi:4-diphosphocytidyl-2-C-methyl-D-erythritol kinase